MTSSCSCPQIQHCRRKLGHPPARQVDSKLPVAEPVPTAVGDSLPGKCPWKGALSSGGTQESSGRAEGGEIGVYFEITRTVVARREKANHAEAISQFRR